MQVVLLERVSKLGQMGEVVGVKDGYARNFLLPQGKALRATPEPTSSGSRTTAPSSRSRNLDARKEAETVAARLDGQTLRGDSLRLGRRRALRLGHHPRHRRFGDRRRLLRRPPPDRARPSDQGPGPASRHGLAAPGGRRHDPRQRRPQPGGGRASGVRQDHPGASGRGRGRGTSSTSRSSSTTSAAPPTKALRTRATPDQQAGPARSDRARDPAFRLTSRSADVPARDRWRRRTSASMRR